VAAVVLATCELLVIVVTVCLLMVVARPVISGYFSDAGNEIATGKRAFVAPALIGSGIRGKEYLPHLDVPLVHTHDSGYLRDAAGRP
jgi:hypothetical protein